MAATVQIVEFRSGAFTPFLPEDSQVNPGVYGAELGFWLCVELAKRGVVTTYPESEDWGWYIEYFLESGSEFSVLCANVSGAKDHWSLTLRRYPRKAFGRDKPPFSEAKALVTAIKALLQEEPSVTDLDWLYAEESV